MLIKKKKLDLKNDPPFDGVTRLKQCCLCLHMYNSIIFELSSLVGQKMLVGLLCKHMKMHRTVWKLENDPIFNDFFCVYSLQLYIDVYFITLLKRNLRL